MAESVQDNQPTSQPDPMADFGANAWPVLQDVEDEVHRSPRLRFHFPWGMAPSLANSSGQSFALPQR